MSGMASCHPDRKVKAKGLCGSCYNSHLINRSPEERERVLASKRARWAERYASRNSEKHAAKQKNRVLRHRYGIDLEEYDRMHAEQGNKCAVCGAVGGDTRATRLYVDHNHNTGVVRSLLCPKCNTAVGVIEQGVGRVSRLAAYLSAHDPEDAAWNALARLDLMLRDAEKAEARDV